MNRLHYTQTSPPVVWRDLVIVGNGVADKLIYPNDPPGDVQAFDVKSGRRVWSFSPVPRERRDKATQTWESESWRTIGHTNVWAPMSVDEQRGLVYLPVSTPSNDWYGGARKGDNLFAESIVCLDARNGERRVALPDRASRPVGLRHPDRSRARQREHRRSDARRSSRCRRRWDSCSCSTATDGTPIWPIVERSVAASDVPGELASRSQPVPTKPKPFAKQGFGFDDLVDFTPEIKQRALDAIRDFRVGPLFTPPSRDGTIVMPGAIGGAGWGGAALDQASGTIFIKATNQPALYKIVAADENRHARRGLHRGSRRRRDCA